MTCGFLARAYGAVGEYEAGLAAVRRVSTGAAGSLDLGDWPVAAEILLHLEAGHVSQAAAVLGEARQFRPPGDVIAYRLRAKAEAELALARGDVDKVLRVTGPVIDHMRREGGRAILCEDLAYHGRALLAAGRLDEAATALAEARALAEATGQRLILWTVLAAQLELAARQGQTTAANALRDKLRTLLHQLADAAGTPERSAGFMKVPAVQAALRLAGG